MSSHRLQLPWGEIETAPLSRLLPLLFLLPLRVMIFLLTRLSLFGRTSFTSLIRVYFLARGTSPVEVARDDIIADLSALASAAISGFCTDLAVAGSCASFNT